MTATWKIDHAMRLLLLLLLQEISVIQYTSSHDQLMMSYPMVYAPVYFRNTHLYLRFTLRKKILLPASVFEITRTNK